MTAYIRIFEEKYRRYDTSTARLLATTRAVLPEDDPAFFEEHLMLTPAGRFFLTGCGNHYSPLSTKAFDHPTGTARYGVSDGCTPLSPDQALTWLVQNNHVAALESLLGNQVTDA